MHSLATDSEPNTVLGPRGISGQFDKTPTFGKLGGSPHPTQAGLVTVLALADGKGTLLLMARATGVQ